MSYAASVDDGLCPHHSRPWHSGAMRMLVIGGTGVIGRAVVDAALARGFMVTSMSRGDSGEVRAPAASVFIDRADDEGFRVALLSERPDIVIDCILMDTDQVDVVTAALPGLHAYVGVWRGDGPLPHLNPSDTVPVSIVATPTVMGPGDLGGSLPSWLQRLGDEFVSIVPAELEQPVDCIDSRDLATGLLDTATKKRVGCAIVRRSDSVELADIIGGCITAITESGGSAAEVLPVESAVLKGCQVTSIELPLWAPDPLTTPSHPNAPILALKSRPIEQTIADTLGWLRSSEYFVPLPDDGGPGFTAARFEEITAAATRLAEPPAVVSLLEARRHRPAK